MKKGNNNGKYYVLTGSNAVMICSNWERAEYCFHTYICSPKRLHSYRSFVLAQRAALDHLHLIAFGIRFVPPVARPCCREAADEQ